MYSEELFITFVTERMWWLL